MQTEDDKESPGTMQAHTADKAAPRPRKMDKSVHVAIGSRLRAYYDGVAREAIPDRFVELLKKLEEKDPDGGKAG
jgi:hypothetical protein